MGAASARNRERIVCLVVWGVLLWAVSPVEAQQVAAASRSATTPQATARKSFQVEAPDENQGIQGFFFVFGSKNVFNLGGPNSGSRSGPRWAVNNKVSSDKAEAAPAPAGSDTSLELFDENQGIQGLFVVVGSDNVFNLGGPNRGPGSGPRWTAKEPPPAGQTVEEEVRAALKQLNDAYVQRDRTVIERLTSEDHVAVTPYALKPQTRAQQLATLKYLQVTKYVAGAMQIRMVSPDVALVTYPLTVAGTYKGKALAEKNHASALWVKSGGQWRETYYQQTAATSR